MTEFIDLHRDELVAKAAQAEGSECPACLAEPAKLTLTEDPVWLRCERGHTIRCWTGDETELMRDENLVTFSPDELNELRSEGTEEEGDELMQH